MMTLRKLILLFSLFGILISLRFFYFFITAPHYSNNQELSFQTTLWEEPQDSKNNVKFSVRLAHGEKISIISHRNLAIHIGDLIDVNGVLKVIDAKTLGNNKNNEQTQHNSRTFLSMIYPEIKVIQAQNNGLSGFSKPILGVFNFIRQSIIELYYQALPPKSASLLLGIVFGIKTTVAPQFYAELQQTGVLHVIAASGMNVTLVAAFLSSIFGFFFRRQLALLISIVGIIFYAFLASFEPSIVRASIMGILGFSALILGRQKLAIYSLFLAAYSMLLLSPWLLFDIGFQLSFMATFGILYIKPLFERSTRIKTLFKKSLVGDDIATTLSAQIATVPILIANFGTYSLWSIVVNALVLWTIPLLMILGGIAGICSFFVVLFGKIVLYLTLPFLLYFEFVISFFSKLGGTLQIDFFSWPFVLAYYFLLLAMIIGISYKEKRV